MGCLSLAKELRDGKFDDKTILQHEIESKLKYLISSRPTAVNMKLAADDLTLLATNLNDDRTVDVNEMKSRYIFQNIKLVIYYNKY